MAPSELHSVQDAADNVVYVQDVCVVCVCVFVYVCA